MAKSIVVGGAGVIGLSITRALSKLFKPSQLQIINLEKNNTYGLETSSRNSGVIHAGIYYPTGSLKSRFCLDGRKLLYNFCEEYSIPYENCGKLLFATRKSQHEQLEQLQKQAITNGLTSKKDALILIENAKELEPGLVVSDETKVLLSPSTGIINVQEYMMELERQAEEAGCIFSYNSEVKSVDKNIIKVDSAGEESEFEFDYFINATGLRSTFLDNSYSPKYVKGNYYKIRPKKYLNKRNKFKFNYLLYPMPEVKLTGLGVHLTFDLQGDVRFGPDIEEIDPKVNLYKLEEPSEEKKSQIFKTVSEYVDFGHFYGSSNKEDFEVEIGDCGVRPKVVGKGLESDFLFRESKNVLHLHGFESPGVTSSLAIGNYVADLVANRILGKT
eukprot:maker-scaffold_4-snap-gene-8.65-mRNA-1 protein AED:0.01 eAED:0.01 QI:157/1/1/1/1/1/3/62/386